jgi:hypothetical protein
MNKELATVLRTKLAGLPFVEILAGMAQTVTQSDPNQDETAPAVITKRFPVSYDVTGAGNCVGTEVALIPDSSKKSIIYFEDFGISVTGRLHGLVAYNSQLRLICWLNRANLVGDHYEEISGRCMASIVDTFNQEPGKRRHVYPSYGERGQDPATGCRFIWEIYL